LERPTSPSQGASLTAQFVPVGNANVARP
jgi:hypothetical protein